MTVTKSKAENDLTPLFRTEIKRNGIVIRGIESDSGHTYHVTIFEGKVTSCKQAGGQECQSWHYRHSCHHATLAMQLEAGRAAVQALASDPALVQAAQEYAQHQADVKAQHEAELQAARLRPNYETSQKGHLHGAQGFSLMR